MIMINDVSRAYFHARATRRLFIEVPAEDRLPEDGDCVGLLNWCLYGTRDAAHNWNETVAKHLEPIGFQRGKAFPSFYWHPKQDSHFIVHGDDYTSSGSSPDLAWLKPPLEKSYEIKTKLVGHTDPALTEATVLNRVIRATPMAGSSRLTSATPS